MPHSTRAVIVGVAVLAALSGCTAGDASPGVASSTTTATATATTIVAKLPIIDQIEEAVAALETELHGAQSFFEINATAQLVNMFVALNNGAVAQPWLYLDGTLTSSEGQSASGGTFDIGSVDFDPRTILSKVLTDLPDITIESFYIHGDGQGNVLYGVLATSAKGGGLDVVLGADGTVKSVDPVT